jgi:predicted metal-dependent peptidase
MKITNDEWFEISNALEPHHAVFTKVWQMGRPLFDSSIPTAAVQFDKNGNFIVFRFNPEFWKSLDLQNKLFVICHESLHIILNHGKRAKDANMNFQAANVAMDVVVNHSLVRNFGFKRNEIDNAENYCWVDTVFKDNEPIPNSNEMFEFYYNLFEKKYGDGMPEEGSCQTVDDHNGMFQSFEEGSDWSDVIDQLNDSLSDEEKEALKSIVSKHFQKSEKECPAGTGTGGEWVFANGKQVQKKKKWETIVKKWVMKVIKYDDIEVENWIRKNRRMHMLPSNLIIPSDYEIEDRYNEPKKLDVYFFLDTSGSCWHLKDRFFSAAESLPPNRFNVRLFCFDTDVQETTLESKKIYGGGGTCFKVIEKHIQMIMSKENKKYPDAVWIVSDGYGTNHIPQHPERWKWFLTEYSINTYLHQSSEKFYLKDYE